MNAAEILTSSEKFHIELGLKRISKIMELLDNPQKNLKIIHIAGSNGKGSTCAILEEILTKAGYKTGKFTSPHLFSYNERITVNKQQISDFDFERLIKKINELDKKFNIELTEFEILTAAGLLYFNEKACDIVILETGLGGRLDSTNVIETPLASIITSISLEHKERLGNTIEEISKEKAGIIKKGCPVVFLKENKGYKTLYNEADKKEGIIFETEAIPVKDGYILMNGEKIKFNLNGTHQGENLALALKAVEILNTIGFKIDQKTLKEALCTVQWKFRLEFINKKTLVDACHNPDGSRVLTDFLNGNFKDKKIKFIFGCLKNKDYKEVLRYLKSVNAQKKICFYEFDYPNALKYNDLIKTENDIEKITNPLLEMNNKNFDLTVICGSIYMLGLIFKDFDRSTLDEI